jgi:CubicO group peptidase (beta-lactamase class C family)
MSELDLRSLLGEHARRHSVPGAAVGLLRNSEVTGFYHGVADATTGEPVTPETRFAVGSLAKSMVATAVARLVDSGRLSLDDPVASHVPELRDARWARRASVRDLLANRSRLPLLAEFEFEAFPGGDDEVLSRFVKQLADGEPMPPVWSYSNAGWAVLGRMLEAVTGLTWEAAMRAEVFDPLHMDRTTFLHEVDVPYASGHEVTTDGVVRAEPWTPRALAPAGATLLSTLTDVLRFARAHLDDVSLAALRGSPEEVRIHAWLDAWCLGWARFDWPGGPVWAAVLLANCGTGRALYRSIFPDLMDAWFGVRVPPLRLEPSHGAAGDLSRFAGVYAWPDRRWEVAATGSSLVLETGDRSLVGLPIDDRTFVVDAADPDTPTVTFDAFDDVGRPGVLYEMLWGLPRV